MVESYIFCKIIEGKHIWSIHDMAETDGAVTSELITASSLMWREAVVGRKAGRPSAQRPVRRAASCH